MTFLTSLQAGLGAMEEGKDRGENNLLTAVLSDIL
jgi:hypothetical protein